MGCLFVCASCGAMVAQPAMDMIACEHCGGGYFRKPCESVLKWSPFDLKFLKTNRISAASAPTHTPYKRS